MIDPLLTPEARQTAQALRSMYGAGVDMSPAMSATVRDLTAAVALIEAGADQGQDAGTVLRNTLLKLRVASLAAATR